MMTQIIHNNEKSIDQIHKNKNIYVVFGIRIMLYLLINKKEKNKHFHRHIQTIQKKRNNHNDRRSKTNRMIIFLSYLIS